VPLTRSLSLCPDVSLSLFLSWRCLDTMQAPPCDGLSRLPALPYAPGSNASDFATMAFSASPAGSTQAVPSTMASAALRICSAWPSLVRADASSIDYAYPCILNSHTTLTSLRLGNATSSITVAATAVISITIVAISTATTTEAPRSDGRSLRDGNIALPEVPEVQECKVVLCRRVARCPLLAPPDRMGELLLSSIVLILLRLQRALIVRLVLRGELVASI